MVATAEAARRLGVTVVNGFTGSSIWHLLYSFPPVPEAMLEEGYADFARRWTPILDAFRERGVRFGLEVHPTEIAFDIATAERAVAAAGNHPAFGFNYDPSHFGYQGVDYTAFLERFADRIFHVHMKDVWWSEKPTEAGIFGGHLPFGDRRRYWEFRSMGRGDIDFEAILRVLNRIGYAGPLSVEWEDSGMDREHGAAESASYVKTLDFAPSTGPSTRPSTKNSRVSAPKLFYTAAELGTAPPGGTFYAVLGHPIGHSLSPPDAAGGARRAGDPGAVRGDRLRGGGAAGVGGAAQATGMSGMELHGAAEGEDGAAYFPSRRYAGSVVSCG